MDVDLVHCIYCSAATRPMSVDEIGALIERARANNARLGVTGMLLHAEGSFFQVLEGRPAHVDALFERIARDPRHAQVTRVIHEPIARRHFPAWSMGLSCLSRAELEQLEGSNDFFGAGHCFGAIDAGRAKKLLAGFRAGRWRKVMAGAAT